MEPEQDPLDLPRKADPVSARPIAHIIVGFIGSGKTTFARKLAAETGAVRFTKDEWMVRLFGNTPAPDTFEDYDGRMAALATDIALACLAAGTDVVIDEGFWVQEHRDRIRARVLDVGAIPKMYFLDAPYAVMKERTRVRTAQPPGDSFVIDEVAFDRYWQVFRPPGDDEDCIRIDAVGPESSG